MERSLGNQVLGWEIQAQANFEKLGGGKRSENLSFDIDHNMRKIINVICPGACATIIFQ